MTIRMIFTLRRFTISSRKTARLFCSSVRFNETTNARTQCDGDGDGDDGDDDWDFFSDSDWL